MITRTYSLLLSILVLLMITPGCADSSDVWGYEVEQAQAKLRDRDYEPFLTLDFSEIDASHALRLGDGAAYYLAQIFSRADMNDESERLLRQSWSSDPEPWRRRALVMLLDRHLAEQRYDELQQLSREALQRYPEDLEIAFYGYEALYRAERYGELLRALESPDLSAPDLSAPDHAVGRWSPAADSALWRAVASYRVDAPDWDEHFFALFSDLPASTHHSRLFLFARNNDDILRRFDRRQMLLIEARYHLADGRADQSAHLFRALLDEPAEEPAGKAELLGPGLLPDLGRALTSGGDWRLSASSLETLLDTVSEHASREQLARCYEYLGRIQRSAGNRTAALDSLSRALALDGRGPDRDRTAWYTLQTLIGSDPAAAVSFLEAQLDSFQNPAYFNGLLESLASQLVQRRDWTNLQRAWTVLDGRAGEGSLAQYSVINAAAIQAGLAPGRDTDARAYLKRAYGQWQRPYYALIAAVLLQRSTDFPRLKDEASDNVGRSESEPLTEAYVEGYFAHGLIDEGYLAARRWAAELSDQALAGWAAVINASHNYIDSMRLMDLVARRNNRVPQRSWAYLMYPRPFSREMAAVIRAELLEPEVFYALVREESYFSADISSRVGAVGLAQLMPATAAEVARAMRIENPNLTDPATNLTIGARYLRGLIDRFGSVQNALLGYNAGPSRVRRWQVQNGVLAPILYQEAVPFYETRDYVRKILVSATFYGRLYGGMEPNEVFEHLFGEP